MRILPLSSSANKSNRFSSRSLRRKLLCTVLILSLLSIPGNHATEAFTVIAASTIEITAKPVGWIAALFDLFKSKSAQRPRKETFADRLSHVSQLHLTPMKMTGYEGDRVTFSALPVNFADQTIQGVRVEWESSNPEVVQIDNIGRALFLRQGLARVTCRAGSVYSSAPVLVREGKRPLQTDEQWRRDQAGLKLSDGGSTGTSASAESMIEKALSAIAPAAQAQSNGAYEGNDFVYDEVWSEPRNLTGSPRNRAIEPTRMGAVMPEGSNFKFAIPIAGIGGGRGIGAGVTLYCNSRVWTRHGNAVTFDPVASWPSPGFSLGFGRIVTYAAGSNTKFALIDRDWTRHYLGQGSGPDAPISGQTSDGSHISFSGTINGVSVSYNDGTTVSYSRINNRLLPDHIQDSNGNYIQVTYRVPVYDENQTLLNPPLCPAQAIDYITDTLGRRIQFNYDSNGKLTSITAPAMGGTAQNPLTYTAANFDYQDITISNSFSGLTVENRPLSAVPAIRHVYFPATSTGYKLDHSAYGMIYNYSARRQMTINNGVISDGVESAATSFNYPTAASSLTDAPTFTQRTESATNSPTSTYTYAVADYGTSIGISVFQPDGSTLYMSRVKDASSVANGLMNYRDIISGGVSFGYIWLGYGLDPGGSVQVQTAYTTNDQGVASRVDYEHDQYGNIKNLREYGQQIGGAWKVRRRTKTTYKTDTVYINGNLKSLPTLIETFDAQQNTSDADDVVIAKSSVTYDDYNAMGGMEVYPGKPEPPGHDSTYDATKTIRGNVTGTTQWIDLATNTSITRLRKIDKFGNTVKEQVSCCNERSYTCTEANGWSQPEQVMSGSQSGLHLMTTADYDFNTGLVERQESPNGVAVNYSYDAAQRPTQAGTTPASATSTASYNDASLSSSNSVTYNDSGTQKTVSNSKEYDGWGRVIKAIEASGAQANTTYNNMGRVISRSNPFATGGTPQYWTNYQYDTLGRATVITLPDNNTVQTSYTGLAVTTIDQVNRKIKRESDSLGRMVKVTEQDASGNLTQETNYTYDLLDRMTQVNQGNQTRSYKYDGLGRLLYERIPEQTATINDGTGTLWSCKYTYTDFNAVQTRTDARGVVTTYGYDSLNRVTQVSYNTASAPGVASTPGVFYIYDNNDQSATEGLLLSVEVGGGTSVAGGSEEDYSYGSLNRVSSATRRINVSPSVIRTYTTSYQYNDAGQITQFTYPSGRVISPSYDSKGRLSAYDAFLSSVSYDSIGRVSAVGLWNGVSESFTYDAQRMQLTQQTATKSGQTRMSLSYNYQASAGQMGAGSTAGNAGQLMSISGTMAGVTESAAYTYDNLGRLVTSNQSSQGVSAQRRFVYDRWGNRTAMWDAVTGGNQIQSVTLEQSGGAPTNRITSVTQGSTFNYSYDAAGNVINDGFHSYTYDAENRVVSVDGGATASYGYDHQNRRIKKTVSGTTTHYVWERGQVLAEHAASSGGVLIDYIYGTGRMMASVASGVTRYYLGDHLSVRMVLDASGDVVGKQTHLPFGEEMATTGTTDKHRFTSYERDGESNSDYAVNRQYGQGIGRFLRPDPYQGSYNISNPQSLNRFAYAQSDPVSLVDPLGLDGVYPGRLLCVILPWLCGERSSSGTNRDPEGRSGGGISISPPGRPTCNLAVAWRGQSTPGVPSFPDDSRDRGLTFNSILRKPDGRIEPVAGVFWNIEVIGIVSDDVSKWEIHQVVSARISGTFTYGGQEQRGNYVLLPPTDESQAVRRRAIQRKGEYWLFWLDTPGLIGPGQTGIPSQDIVPITAVFTITGTSSITQGSVKCSVNWKLTLTWRNQQLLRGENQSFFYSERESF